MSTRTRVVEGEHPTPKRYATIGGILAVITAIEVAIYYIQALRPIIVPVFLILSAVKFALVVMFFMHLKFDNRMFSGFFVFGLLVAGSLAIALMALMHQIVF